MKIISDPAKDVRTANPQPGGYEWWYFDGTSADGQYSFVVIFYDGNPFSTRYIRAMERGQAMPSQFPAISISVYKQKQPVYYSFTEFDERRCFFGEREPKVKVGPHSMRSTVRGEQLSFELDLNETLPSGDKIEARLEFKSSRQLLDFKGEASRGSAGHLWNLVQPRARVEGRIQVAAKGELPHEISFLGTGYHDHNRGDEPMRDEFDDWYWGRLHFEHTTLVYYVMNRRKEKQHRAWLIDKQGSITDRFDDIELSDQGLSLFGLQYAHKLRMHSNLSNIQIQQSSVLDSGPFYLRFMSDGFLQLPDRELPLKASGFSEYIRPDRIYSRIFWPLVNMRIRRHGERPHWVQRSKHLYRWTW